MNIDKLQTLIEHGRKANDEAFSFALVPDDASHLQPLRANAWSQFLLSIATTEAIEESLLSPLKAAFPNDEKIQDCLTYHGADEDRHGKLLKDYVRMTFGQMKKKRTKADIIVYDSVLPTLANLLKARPACFVGVLYFYESFSLDFYTQLKTCAKADGLPNLVKLLQSIEKDELRHLACLEILLERIHKKKTLFPKMDLWTLRPILQLLLADISTAPWAFYNQRVRENVIRIGLDQNLMNNHAKAAAQRAVQFLKDAI